MREFRLSKDADYDIKEISRYTTLEFGDKQALTYRNEMFKILRNLAQRPNLGRDASYLIQDAKRYNYKARIFYTVNQTRIFVLRILSQKQDFK